MCNTYFCSLTLTVFAENGGFRKLKNHSSSFMDYFVGQTSIKSTMFRFDFVKPYHCLQNKSHPCSVKALNAINDITKVIRIYTFINHQLTRSAQNVHTCVNLTVLFHI